MKFHFNHKFVASLTSFFAAVDIFYYPLVGRSLDYLRMGIWAVLLILIWKKHIAAIVILSMGAVYLFIADIILYAIDFQSSIDLMSDYQNIISMPIEIIIILLMLFEGIFLSIFICHGIDIYIQNKQTNTELNNNA